MAFYKKIPPRDLQPAGRLSNQVTKRLVSKKENFLASILYDWPLIVGEKYADALKPNKISFPNNKNSGATLHLSVSNSSIALITHHLQPLILGKINQFVGYAAFEKICLHQSLISQKMQTSDAPPKSKFLSSQDCNELEKLLCETPDGDLKDALKALGHSLYLQRKS